jgi:hypothetical protein
MDSMFDVKNRWLLVTYVRRNDYGLIHGRERERWDNICLIDNLAWGRIVVHSSKVYVEEN